MKTKENYCAGVVRFSLLRWIMIAVGGIIIARSFYLQVIQGSSFALQAEDNRIVVIPQLAARGIIYDQSGNQLAENIASTDLLLDPAAFSLADNEAALLEKLPVLLDLGTDDIKNALQRARERKEAVLLAKALPHETVIRLASVINNLPGLRLASSSVRNYLYPRSFAHVLGYTSPVTEEELAGNNQLLMSDATGKTGIEYQYDGQLRGQNGAIYMEINAAGSQQKRVAIRAPASGSDLVLTLDLPLQEFIYSLLAELKNAGSVLVLDARNGAVRALVNYPSFNPNAFSQPALQAESLGYLQSAEQPLFNRAIKGVYPPGSTIKPLLAAAGLHEKVISANTTILSTGGIQIGEWNFPDWKTGGHGVTDVSKAIAESVNSFFYLLTGGDETHEGLGIKKARQYLQSFSWGNPTGIDLPGEAAGLIPSPEWKRQVKNESWYIGDSYHLGIGQGDVLITPLQLTVAVAAIANRGTVYKPYLAADKKNGDEISGLRRDRGYKLPMSENTWQVVQDGMRQAVTQGSARALLTLPVNIAGKTGTAQTGKGQETHAWFTSFGPIDRPEIVVTVLLEKGGKGDIDAIPIAQKIWQWWIEKRYQ